MAESIAFGLENFDTDAVMPLVLPGAQIYPADHLRERVPREVKTRYGGRFAMDIESLPAERRLQRDFP